MTQHGKAISIQGINAVIVDMDYGESREDSGAALHFNIRFDIELYQKLYSISYSRPVQVDDHFSVSGDDYETLLQALEPDQVLTAKNQYSALTEQALHAELLPIAESVYEDIEYHSPDQDEE
ncbi:hypothetical protein LG200_13725 [Methylobacillus caricis]|uniref:hypothetical protein n=1 Tax=Methylobacillus caricis TaxID=1971611 RepID=UPI001D000659|nr:hypothetical protein [Methylobacillus caricis]MCB5189063.1 hypothetical protein [Methylobacillus caricis]